MRRCGPRQNTTRQVAHRQPPALHAAGIPEGTTFPRSAIWGSRRASLGAQWAAVSPITQLINHFRRSSRGRE